MGRSPKSLAKREGKPIALQWIDAAILALREYEAWITGGSEPISREVVSAALTINFSFPDAHGVEAAAHVAAILQTFIRSREVLVRSRRYFVGVSEKAAKKIFPSPPHGDIPPAYAIFERGIYFTPRFAPYDPKAKDGFGPLCRAAMVLHESIHVIDPISGHPAVHISEWDEPGFSAQSVDESVHNPSSYASFAAQVHAGALEWPRSVRYGAGRPAE